MAASDAGGTGKTEIFMKDFRRSLAKMKEVC